MISIGPVIPLVLKSVFPPVTRPILLSKLPLLLPKPGVTDFDLNLSLAFKTALLNRFSF